MGERDLASEPPARRAFFAERSVAAWGVLGGLLAALFVLALRFSPPGLEKPASSTAPPAPFSVSGDLEPFLTLRVGRGASVVAALAVALAALLVAMRLENRIGRAAPLWVGVFLFGSLAFAAVFWTPAGAILMAAVAIAFALAQGGEPPATKRMPEIWDEAGSTRGFGGVLRWLVVGALLGAAAASHPLYLGLLVPAALAAPALGRRRARLALGLGAVALLAAGLVLGGLERWLGGVGPLVFDVKLAGWNLLYLGVGRHVGLLPYFLPLLLALGAADEERGRVALGVVVVALAVAFALLRPFDFFGGPSALGNRFFLPLYGAAWLCAAKPARAWPALAVAALAGALLWPSWRHPLAGPLTAGGQPRHTAHALASRLPFELSQRDLPGARDAVHQGLRVRFLDGVWPAGNGESLRLGAATGEVAFAAGPPLGSLLLEFGPGAATRLELEGGGLEEMILRPDGDIAWVVTLGRPFAVMPSWWSRAPVHWYRLRLRFPEAPVAPLAFSIAPQRKPGRAAP